MDHPATPPPPEAIHDLAGLVRVDKPGVISSQRDVCALSRQRAIPKADGAHVHVLKPLDFSVELYLGTSQ